MAEQLDTMSSIKLGGFQSQLEVSYVSSYTDELWYNETVSLWMIIYIYIYIKKIEKQSNQKVMNFYNGK